MYRIVLIAFIGCFIVGLTGCKKVYTCQCEVTTVTDEVNVGGIIITSETKSTTDSQTSNEKVKKKVAEASCNELNGTVQETGYSVTYDCSIVD